MFTGGYDCLIIPQGSAKPASANANVRDLIGSEFCGRGLLTAPSFQTADTDAKVGTVATYSTICCKFL